LFFIEQQAWAGYSI